MFQTGSHLRLQMMSSVRFDSLKFGDEFEYLNFDYLKIMRCIKTGDENAREIEGSNFFVYPYELVFRLE